MTIPTTPISWNAFISRMRDAKYRGDKVKYNTMYKIFSDSIQKYIERI